MKLFSRIKNIFLRCVATVLLVGTLSACGSHYGVALIQSKPEGAQVVDLEDDSILGITPVRVTWTESNSERKFINIRTQKEGYNDKTAAFWISLKHRSKKKAMSEPQFVEVKLEKESP